jgi:hypothetical protein
LYSLEHRPRKPEHNFIASPERATYYFALSGLDE